MTAPFTQNTLGDIISKVRKLTARGSVNQISDASIIQYINTYYLYNLPESLRYLTLRDTFTFYTNENQEVYPFPNNLYYTCEPPCYSSGQQMDFFNSRDLFYRTWPSPTYIQTIGAGNGSSGPYTGTLSNTPFLRSINPQAIFENVDKVINVTFGASLGTNPETSTYCTDDGNGGILDINGNALIGTIDYATGAFSINFPVSIPSGTPITCNYIPIATAQPRSILFAQNQIFLRPVPDQVYVMTVTVERMPTQLMTDPNQPELNEWWELLAFGAARKILVDNGDYETVSNMQPFYEEQLLLTQRRTLNQLTNQRSSTIYSDHGQYPYSNLYPYI